MSAVELVASPRQVAKGGFSFITWEGFPCADKRTLEEFGGKAWFLPVLPQEEAKQLLNDYCAMTSDLGLVNGRSSGWWYTWSSSRDRYHSRILAEMELLRRIRLTAGDFPKGRTVFLCLDPYLADAVRTILAAGGMNLVSEPMDKFLWWMRRLKIWIAPWIAGARVVARQALFYLQLRRTRQTLQPPTPGIRRGLLVTWLKHSDLEGRIPVGTYFGRLPLYLKERGVEVAFFGGLIDTELRVRSASNPAVPVAALPQWLRLRDFPRAYLEGLLAPVHVPQEGYLRNAALKSLVERDIHENRGKSVVFSLLMERSLVRFLQAYRPDQIVHICENNPWERACSRAARYFLPEPETVGYLHCAAVLSHTKIIMTEQDRRVRPRPKGIICTGQEPKDILIRYGGHLSEETLAGCAWRFEYLKSIKAREAPRWNGSILVVLEGLSSMVQLIWFMHQALAGQTEIKARFRAHPQYPLEQILSEASLSLQNHPTLSKSPYKSLAEDFEAADLVVYKGSTAAMEAGCLGIPLIHVRTPNILTDDPLFEISEFKRVVSHPEEFIPAVRELAGMSPEQFERSHAAFRHYVDSYLAPPDEESISLFMPGSHELEALRVS